MASVTNSPGWYPDPDGGQGERWWNGAGWSDARRGVGAPPAPVARPTVAAPAAPGAVLPPPVLYSASNPAPQHPGQYAAPGAPGYTPRAATTVDARQNPQSLYALIAGVVAFFANILLVPSILAIVFGMRALARSQQLRAAGQEDRTRGLAIAGLVMGIIGGVFGLIQGIFFIVGFLPLFFFDYTS